MTQTTDSQPPHPLIPPVSPAPWRRASPPIKELAIGGLLLAVCVVLAVLNPRFLGAVNIENQLRLLGLYGIFAIGMGLVIITGGIDLSVGSAFALEGVLLAIMLVQWRLPWPVAVAGAMALMALLGLIHAVCITVLRLQPFLVTLCGLLVYRSQARVISHDNTLGFGNDHFGLLWTLAAGKLGPVPMPFVMLVAIAAVMWVVLHRSVYGRYLFAVGRNEEAARYSGINTRLVVGSVYVISMLLGGISGIQLAFYTNSIGPSEHGLAYELWGIAAAVLGGCSLRGGEGSILGIVLGTALLLVLRNAVTLLGIPSSWEYTVLGLVILAGATIDQATSLRRRAAPPPAPGA